MTTGYIFLPVEGGGGGSFTAANLTDAGTDGITITGGTNAVNGSGTSISQHKADSTHNGYLSSTDWSTFNNKQSALTLGNLTDAGTDGITVTGGTGAVVGSGTSLSQHVADASHNGYLSSSDWSTFNAKAAFPSIVAVSSNVTLTANALHTVNTSAARSLALPNPANCAGQPFILKDVTGSASSNNITITRFGSEKIENVAASFVYNSDYGSFTLMSDATNWWLI